MTNYRKVVLANDQIYHIYNRGIEHKTIFTTKWEYRRAVDTLRFYRLANLPIKLSQFLNLPREEREKTLLDIEEANDELVEIISFCLMPNHFHFLLKQLKPNGITKLLSNFTNSYTKYFNTRHKRLGPLCEGMFKAVLIETEEQLVHVNRYIHLNPVTSFIVKTEDLDKYPWSSLPEYLQYSDKVFCQKDIVLSHFSNTDIYKQFLYDQVAYARELDKIKHLVLEA